MYYFKRSNLNTIKNSAKEKYPKEVKESIVARNQRINVPIEIMKDNEADIEKVLVSVYVKT